MTRAHAAATLLTAALACLSCGSPGTASSAAAPITIGPLPEGIVARVGVRDIHAQSVGRIAALQHLDVQAARDLAVRDALFADAAEARGLDVEAEVRGVLARRLLRSIREDVAKVPITPQELADAAAHREQRSHVPASIVSPDLLESDVFDARSRGVVIDLLGAHQAQIARVKDEAALLASVTIEQ